MRNETALFAERLRNYLKVKSFDARPVELMKLLGRLGFASVTQQTISGWLSGKHMPKPDAMRALAQLLDVDPQDLQFGARMAREVREPNTAWPDHLSGPDRLLFEEFLRLPAEQRDVVRKLVRFLSRPAKA
jgi:transcriptional regulator with XRE-family HTH domain